MSDGRNRSGGRRPSRGRSKGRGGRGRQQPRARAKAGQGPPSTFWGSPDPSAAPPEPVVLTEDPAAVVRSLGPPPLGDRETIAEHYFEAVYAKAVALAGALAAAAGILADPDADRDAGPADSGA